MNLNIAVDVLRNSILITGMVLIMMLMIEYFNIHSQGRWFAKLNGSGFGQVVLGAMLGLIPGCIGGFAVVSLFTHKMLSFGALVAMMICSSGDEAFVILAMIPEYALPLFGAQLVIGVASGLAVDKFFKKPQASFCPDGYEIHNEAHDALPSIFKWDSYKDAFKSPSTERLLILAGITLFICAVAGGYLEHGHTEHAACEHTHIGVNLLSERWIHVTFAIFSIITVLFTATAKEHFIKEHIWEHVIKKHMLSILLWTFGALLVCQIGISYLNIQEWISNNMFWVMILAILIGIIPESGPHLIFVTLFAQGVIPFYVLLVNSIVQDGHSALPLLADSKSGFAKAKLVNMAIGLAVGTVCWIFF
ncbi:MAG: arsenic efflux protein [Bacteroidales bacterium]|nr:arsenic efflux protein [Bacteroidales bacterium]